jgi:hypothetical protein
MQGGACGSGKRSSRDVVTGSKNLDQEVLVRA